MDNYAKRTYGDTKIGMKGNVGIVVVDFQKGFTEAQYPLGGAPLVMRALKNTANLLNIARQYNIPIAHCNTAYKDERDQPYWKISGVRETFLHDHPSAELDPIVYNKDYDVSVCKFGPSIFFQTSVVPYFIKQNIETVIVTGCTTSGCIRASTIDSFANGFRTMVPEDCVGDMEEQPHKDNLRDVGRRYADIVSSSEVIDYIKSNKQNPN